MEFKREKFRNLVQYICHKADTKDLGSTKLNKILWYADSSNYLLTGNSMTGETYKKDQFGPIPQHILPVIDEMEACGELKREKSVFYGLNKTDYHSLKEPAAGMISEQEAGIVDQLIGIICKNHTAASISELTHDRIWKIAEQGEEIPMYLTLVANIEKTSDAGRAWALTALSE